MVSVVPANPLIRRKVVKKTTRTFKKPQHDRRHSVPVRTHGFLRSLARARGGDFRREAPAQAT